MGQRLKSRVKYSDDYILPGFSFIGTLIITNWQWQHVPYQRKDRT